MASPVEVQLVSGSGGRSGPCRAEKGCFRKSWDWPPTVSEKKDILVGLLEKELAFVTRQGARDVKKTEKENREPKCEKLKVLTASISHAVNADHLARARSQGATLAISGGRASHEIEFAVKRSRIRDNQEQLAQTEPHAELGCDEGMRKRDAEYPSKNTLERAIAAERAANEEYEQLMAQLRELDAAGCTEGEPSIYGSAESSSGHAASTLAFAGGSSSTCGLAKSGDSGATHLQDNVSLSRAWPALDTLLSARKTAQTPIEATPGSSKTQRAFASETSRGVGVSGPPRTISPWLRSLGSPRQKLPRSPPSTPGGGKTKSTAELEALQVEEKRQQVRRMIERNRRFMQRLMSARTNADRGSSAGTGETRKGSKSCRDASPGSVARSCKSPTVSRGGYGSSTVQTPAPSPVVARSRSGSLMSPGSSVPDNKPASIRVASANRPRHNEFVLNGVSVSDGRS
eukprot:TRINITY_DN17183_c0_g1_i2.p1 TRINITY_DN17183_c0_g1~~TRINITY_DN17183_c0_g1_i2.p1  ORF type:complete len:459 (+),score=58.41 TRINITY_DN17183_c0_g1_i2:163-1539(+)